MAIDLSCGSDAKIEDLLEGTGKTTLESGVYDATVKQVYFTKTKSGTDQANVVLDIKGQVKTFPLYICYKENGKPTRKNAKGVIEVMPGYKTLNALSYVITGKTVDQLAQEDKTVMIYNFTAKKEEPNTATCLVELMGAKIKAAIKQVNKHKQVKVNGIYTPTTETFLTNEVDHYFSEDGFTASELVGKKEATYCKVWSDKFTGKIIEEKLKTTPVDVSMEAAKASAGGAGVSVDDLFND